MHVEYEKADFVAFAKAHDKTKNRKQRILQLFLVGLCCLLEILMIAFYVSFGDAGTHMIVLMILIPVLGAEMLLMPRILALTMAKTNRKIGSIDMCFGENEVSARRAVESTVYQYNAFESIIHANGAFYLYINRQQALVIPERCFVEGDPAAFGAFLTEKTGLEVKELN
jgi:hypothetical protein